MARELILGMSISVDGFVAGPNGESEWMLAARSEVSARWLADRYQEVGIHAMGHNSYREMAAFWPGAKGPFAPSMNGLPKVIFSRSGQVSAPALEKLAAEPGDADPAALESWLHPRVLGTDFVADVQRLKEEDGKPINALGGARFATSLLENDLVDVLRLIVHPVILGQGMPIFAGRKTPLRLELEDVKTFESGAMIKTYRPIVAR